jgi:hypothetical protein
MGVRMKAEIRISITETEINRLWEIEKAAQAVVDNLSDRQRHLNGKDVMGISKLKALLDGGEDEHL